MIESLLGMLAANAVVALAIALVALLASKFVRRPAIVHGLWLLVLVKLVTPPIISLPVLDPIFHETVALASGAADGEEAGVGPVSEDQILLLMENLGSAALPVEQELPGPATAGTPVDLVLTPLILMLVAGALAVVLLTWVRVRAFNRVLRWATSAPRDLLDEVREVGHRLGVKRIPEVLLVPGCISPMLWTWGGRTRMVLPWELLQRLEHQERRTLIAHELAHFRRGDHLVRLLELMATVFYWWCPLLYVARRGLRQAEEECCDAWVLWAEPDQVRTYADALLETVDFMSGHELSLPPAASGMTGGRSLRRRVEMIVNANTPRGAGALGRSVLILVAMLALPLSPAFTQERPHRERAPGAPEAARPQERPDAHSRGLEAQMRRMEKRLRRVEEMNRELQKNQRQQNYTPFDRTDRKEGEWRRQLAQRQRDVDHDKRAREQHERMRKFEREMAKKLAEGNFEAVKRMETELARSKAAMERRRRALYNLEAVEGQWIELRASQKADKEHLQEARRRIAELSAHLAEARKAGDEARAVELHTARTQLRSELKAMEKAKRSLRKRVARDPLRAPRAARPTRPARPDRAPRGRHAKMAMLEDRLARMKAEMDAMMSELDRLRKEDKAERRERSNRLKL